MIQVGKKKFSVSAYIAVVIVILILIVIAFLMFKYSVEGESKPPFIISKVIVTSSAKTTDMVQKDATFSANILQNNDIKIVIEKNSEYKKESKIKKITMKNIKITDTENRDKIAIYRPSMEINRYDYLDKYVVKENLEYIGGLKTNLKSDTMTISNQGGIIEFSVAQYNLGEMQYIENEPIEINGTLLNRIGKTSKDISFKLTFDMIIELENGTKFKTTITMDLPKGNIAEKGVEIYEHTDFKTVFKRI